MSVAPSRVYAARLVGLPIFDPQGDQVGKVRDLVVTMRSEAAPPRVLGMVAEVFGRRRRLPADDPGDDDRQRAGLHDRPAQHAPLRAALDRDPGHRADAGPHRHHQEQRRRRHPSTTWRWSARAPATGCSAGSRSRSRRRACADAARPTWSSGTTSIGLAREDDRQGATHLVAAINEMRPADAASMLHDLPVERRTAVAMALDDERLADVLEELPEEDQVGILRAARTPSARPTCSRRCRPTTRPT